jgi:signal transduction histidine kinase
VKMKLLQLRFILVFIIICSCWHTAFSQFINEAEYNYFIVKNVRNQKAQNDLQKIHELILRGKYDDVFNRMKSFRYDEPAANHNLALYQASMDYIKSNYDASISKSDQLIAHYYNNKKSDFYIRSLHTKARSVSAIGKNDIARNLIKEAISLHNQNKNDYLLSLSYYYLGVFISESGKHEEAIVLFEKSKNISERIQDKISKAATQSFIGLSLSHLGKYSEAIDIINESIDVRIQLGDKRGLANSYLNMNKVYTELGDNDKRLQYEKKSLLICEEIGDKQCISGRLTNIGDILFREGDIEKAILYQINAQKIAKEIGIKYRIAETHYHLAEIFNAKREFKIALKHIDTCIQLRIGTEDFEGIGTSSILKAQILLNLNRTIDAKKEAKSAYKLSSQNKLIHVKRDAHEILAEIYEKDGDADKALFHYKNFYLIKDSLFNIEKSKAILRKEIEKKYQVEEFNNKKIQSEKEFELANQKEKTSKLIWIGIITIIALIIISYLFYLKYASQKSINKIVKTNKSLSDQLTNLEKQSIFSQTIASVSHELNTPLGIVKAATNEYQTLLTNAQTAEEDNLNETELRFLSHISTSNRKEIRLSPSISGKEKRLKINSISKLLNSSNQQEINTFSFEVAAKIFDLNLDEHIEKELIIELVNGNLTLKFLNYLHSSEKKKLLELSIEQAIKSSFTVVKELNELAENQMNNGKKEKVFIFEELQRLVNIHLENVVSELQIEVDIKPELTLLFDRQQFIQISNLLLNNMIEAFDGKTFGARVRIHSNEDEREITLLFQNNGKEIPPHEINRIFDRFYTTKNKSAHRGLGLSIVKHTMESYNGKIMVSSNEQNTIFELKFRKSTGTA